MNKIKQLREDYKTATEDYKDRNYSIAFIEMEKVANTAIQMLENVLEVLDE